MRAREKVFETAAVAVVLVALAALALAPAWAAAATGFGPLSGASGCLAGPEANVSSTSRCGFGKGLLSPNAVVVSPDGDNVYVVSGKTEATVAASFGSLAILKRDPATGAISEIGCFSSDGTDGFEGASGACTATPSLLGADGVTVSADGRTVFVASNESASVVAFSRDPATGMLVRLGCFQYHPYPGSGCAAANVFPGSAALVTSADSRALYIASPILGSISTLTGALVAPAGPTGSTGATGASPGEAPVASIFGVPEPSFLANPCVAVNGYDGTCGVGVATRGLDSLALAPGGEQIYAVAPDSKAIDVFTHSPTGMLSQSGCMMAGPPPGLCSASKLLEDPASLAISPDGKNVYVADTFEPLKGRIDVLARNSSTGALSDVACVEESPAPRAPEPHEEEEGGGEHEPAPPPSGCSEVPGLASFDAIAVTGDGSMVYAIGHESAVVFSRDAASGRLTEVACSASNDSRCASFPSLSEPEGIAVSPDGRSVYVASRAGAVFAFGLGLAVASASTSANTAGIARVRVRCPHAMRRDCAGRLELTRTVRAAARRGRRSRLGRMGAGGSGPIVLRPGSQAIVAVRLSSGARALLSRRHRLSLVATVRSRPSAGGGGYGRPLRVRAAR